MVFNIESILELFKHGNRHIKSWAHYTCQPPPEPLKTPQAKVQSCLSAEPCERFFIHSLYLKPFTKRAHQLTCYGQWLAIEGQRVGRIGRRKCQDRV